MYIENEKKPKVTGAFGQSVMQNPHTKSYVVKLHNYSVIFMSSLAQICRLSEAGLFIRNLVYLITRNTDSKFVILPRVKSVCVI
jgi:hypothetical protein